jgi:ferric-dicitrate binding protein FerR (iron transport regulator)
MNEQENIRLITRVLAGEASQEEHAQLKAWCEQNAENDLRFRELSQIWNQAEPMHIDTELAWKQFEQKLERRPTLIWSRQIIKIAAALLIVSGLGLLLGKILSGSSYVEVQTALNEVKQITLPDGSIVWLNQGSSLSYERKFSEDERKVILEGEAFFEVVKNPAKPFVINSSQSVTKVLGTSFNLNTSGNDELLTVVTGKVSFASNTSGKEVVVTANESARIDQNGNAVKEAKQDVNAMAWKTNTLSFNDASLEEVFKSLEHYFNIRITVENTRIHNCHFTGEFVKPTFKQVMDVIGKTLQLTYEQKGKQVLVKGKGCE